MHENLNDLELQQYLENKKLQEDALAANRQRKQSKNNKNNFQNHQQIWLENNFSNKNYDNLISPDLIQINEHPLPPQTTNKKQQQQQPNNMKPPLFLSISLNVFLASTIFTPHVFIVGTAF